MAQPYRFDENGNLYAEAFDEKDQGFGKARMQQVDNYNELQAPEFIEDGAEGVSSELQDSDRVARMRSGELRVRGEIIEYDHNS